MSELRHDPLSGHDVIVAAGHAARPVTFSSPPGERRSGSPRTPAPDCPFCPGQESRTPPEVVRTGAGDPGTPGWRVRVFPNLYPIVETHEVVALSPAHARSVAELDEDEVVELFTVLRDRVRTHLAAGHVYAVAIVNHLRPAGASIEHPHAQVFALDTVPADVTARIARFRDAGHDLVDDDAAAEELTVSRTPALTWCPPASTSPYLVRVTHARAGPGFDTADDDVLADTALAAREVLARLDILLGDPPYNLVVHTAPPGAGPYHWYVEIVPRLSVIAGFEQATGILVNTVPPERAAAELREGRAVSVVIHICITIAESPDTVWKAVERIETHTEWMLDAETITFRSAQRTGVGAEFDCLTRVGPLHTTDHFVVTRWEPGVVMGIEHRGAVTGVGEFRLRPLARGDATDFCWDERLTFPWWLGSAAGEQFGRPVLRRIWKGNLRRLKAHVERGPVA